MHLDVSELKREHGGRLEVPLSFELEPEGEGDSAVTFPSPFTGEAVALGMGESILVQVSLAGEAELACSRCLTRFRLPIRVSFAEEFRPGAPQGLEPQEDAEGHLFSTFAGDHICVADVVRQALLLELPMKPICRPDCQGLCPVCGRNLNEGPHECRHVEGDLRFAVLKKLLEQKD